MRGLPGRRRLVPLYRAAAGAAPADWQARWIAHRLYVAHGDQPVRTLEALAAAEANRLRALAAARPMYPALPAPPDDARYRACLRTARRALSGVIEAPVGAATRYHRRDVDPPWARNLLPAAEVGGYVFYAPDGRP